MALFDKTIEKKVKAPKQESAIQESVVTSKTLSRPRITEKAYALNALNQYVFVVTKESTKRSIKRAIEETYGVSVEAVNIVKLPAKKKVSGRARTAGFKGAVKKAIVSVAEGQAIELFKGGM